MSKEIVNHRRFDSTNIHLIRFVNTHLSCHLATLLRQLYPVDVMDGGEPCPG